MLETIGGFIKSLDGLIWGLPMILLLFGAHIFLTVRTGVIQRKTFLGIRLSVAKDKGADGDISWPPPLAPAILWAWAQRWRWAGRAPCCGAG